MIEDSFNVLAVVSTAAFAGVMICIAVTLGGYWRSLEPKDFLAWFARNNQFVARSVPVTVAPAIVGYAGSIIAGWGESDAWLWVAAALCLVAVLALTGGYFVPANTAFASGEVTPADVPSRLRHWLSIHTLRVGLAVAGATLGCVALING